MSSEKDIKSGPEGEVEVASGEIIQFKSSTDAAEYRRHYDHLTMLKGTNTVLEEAQYAESQDPQTETLNDADDTLVNVEPQNISNLESLPLPEFVIKLRKARMSQLVYKPPKAA